MKLKPILFTLFSILLCIGVLSLSACITPNSAKGLATATKIAVKDGTYLYLQAHPEKRPAFELAADSLGKVADAEAIDFNLVLEIFNGLPLAYVSNPTTKLLITDLAIILNEAGAQIPLDEVANLRPIVLALRDGINAGLQISTAPKAAAGIVVVTRSGETLR